MSSTFSSSDLKAFQRLRELRSTLLKLHKALLEFERAHYEDTHGPIASTGEFFRLVIDDEWFSWLRPMSQFIVQIDDTLSSKEAATLSQADALLTHAKALIQPAEAGTLAEQRYFQAIQQEPEIALLHADASDLLR